MKQLKVLLIVVGFLCLILLVWLLPTLNGDYVFEQNPNFDFRSSGFITEREISSWNNQEYFTDSKPDEKYLNELKKKFLALGFSDKYFDSHFRLIYANKANTDDREEIRALFYYRTDSWLDGIALKNWGQTKPFCEYSPFQSKPLCRNYVNEITAWINLGKSGKGVQIDYRQPDKIVKVYSIQGIIWHDDELVRPNSMPIPIENSRVLSAWEAGLLAKSCVPFSTNSYRIHLSPEMDFEYRVNGGDFSTLFDSDYFKIASVNLVTGKVSCEKQASRIY